MEQAPRRLRVRNRAAPSDSNLELRITPLGQARKRADVSRQAPDDTEFGVDATVNRDLILPTPFALRTMHRLTEESSIIPQCLDAYQTNIASYGFRVVPRREGVEMNKTEVNTLNSWIIAANVDESLSAVHGKHIYDYEKYGFGYYEIVRNRRGEPSLMRYARASRIRLIRKQDKPVVIKSVIVRGGRRTTVTEKKFFRRFAQLRPGGFKTDTNFAWIYFKEMGDPRKMNWRTGLYQGERGQTRVTKEDEATEILYARQEGEGAYGLPRWIGNLPGVLGSRESEVVNLRYFEDNTVPPMMLLVSGGRLTRKSFEDLDEVLTKVGIGQDRQNQIMLVEAVPETTGIEDKGTVDLKLEKLTNSRQSDSLFSEYDEANQAKIQSAFRLPPVLIGKAQDITFATANVSAFIAEQQVFLPERRRHDETLNKRFVNAVTGLNLQTVKLESKGPQITAPEQVIKTLTAANVMGALTPRNAQLAINEAMELSIPEYPEEGEDGHELFMDQPISMTLKGLGRSDTMPPTGRPASSSNTEQGLKDQDTKEVEGDIDPGSTGGVAKEQTRQRPSRAK